MNKLLTVIKILVLLSAAGVAVTRFIAFKYEAAFSPDVLHTLQTVSVACAAVLLVSGAAWVLAEKKAGRK